MTAAAAQPSRIRRGIPPRLRSGTAVQPAGAVACCGGCDLRGEGRAGWAKEPGLVRRLVAWGAWGDGASARLPCDCCCDVQPQDSLTCCAGQCARLARGWIVERAGRESETEGPGGRLLASTSGVRSPGVRFRGGFPTATAVSARSPWLHVSWASTGRAAVRLPWRVSLLVLCGARPSRAVRGNNLTAGHQGVGCLAKKNRVLALAASCM
eukprot:353716-Chlamydomonas_euryale.AAC.2